VADAVIEACHTIAKVIQYSGIFVALTVNPDHPESHDSRYPDTVQFQSGQYEGAPLIVTLAGEEGRPSMSFLNYYWSRQSYEDAMIAAGMAKPTWHPLIVSEAGRHALPAAYWEGWLANTNHVVMVARHGPHRTPAS